MPGSGNKDFRFAVFGRISYTDHFIKELNRLDFPKPIVFTKKDSEFQRDKNILQKYNLFGELDKLSKSGLCELHKVDDINTKEVLKLLFKKECNIGISINCRSIIKKDLINYFSKGMLNIHSAHLPYERGAAGATWKILNNIDNLTCTLHHMTTSIDDGDIVLTSQADIDISKSLPIDVIKKSHKVAKLLITDFLEKLSVSYSFERKVQDSSKSLYFPRLYTPINAAIDWNWKGIYIDRFIRAFGSPYEGAWSYCKGTKVSLIRCSITFLDIDFHPYSYGRVVSVTQERAKVIVNGGHLDIFEIRVDNKPVDLDAFLLAGDIFYNSSDDIEKSRVSRLKTSNME